ncbi:unknown [Clostridium sp. CAG:242]|nr:unknown [Clostridium sp. CAG:242]
MVQTLEQFLIIELVEECHFLWTLFHNIGQNIFHHVLCQVHHVVEVCKCDFRLHHPEFSCMTGGVGFFCTEGWTEGVNIGECHCHTLCFQLSRNGQTGWFTKEVLAVINLAVLGAWWIFHIQSGNMEHFAGALTVTACNQWSMCVNKAALIEEFVDCKCCYRTNTEYCAEGVGSRSQMSDGAQKFNRMTFFLKRIIWGGKSFDCDFVSMDFIWLFCFRCQNQLTFYNNGSTNVELADFIKIFHLAIFKYYLQILEAGTVIQFDKAQVFGCSDGSAPSSHSQLLICIFFFAGCELSQFYSLHRFYLHL